MEIGVILSFLFALLAFGLYKPALLGSLSIAAGTVLNRFAIAQNGGHMPVFPTLSYLTGYIDPAMLGPAVDGAHDLPRAWPDTSFYAFTGHPSLRHARYRAAYGDYPVGLGPGDTELAYAYQYRVGDGPRIVWPQGYPTGGLFGHIGEVKTETML